MNAIAEKGFRVTALGAGSGGAVATDLLCRDPRISSLRLWDRDVFEPPNHHRHLASPEWTGKPKVDFLRQWIQRFRPDIKIETRSRDLLAEGSQEILMEDLEGSDLLLDCLDCAAASAAADGCRRELGKTSVLGAVLSGGIGGILAVLSPRTGCRSCLDIRLGREQTEPAPPAPDYSDPDPRAREETRIPASFSSICCIAALHAQIALKLLEDPEFDLGNGANVLLVSLSKVTGIFEIPFRVSRLHAPRNPDCPACGILGLDEEAADDILKSIPPEDGNSE